MSAAPATTVAAPVTIQAPVTSTIVSSTPATVTTVPQSSSVYYSNAVSYQTLPTVSSVMVAPTVVAPAAVDTGAGGGMRVTIVPIKEGTEEALTKFMASKEVSDEVSALTGFQQAQGFFADNKLVVMAKYDNVANMEAGAEKNKEILGKAAEHFAGAPTKHQSEIAWSYQGRGKADGPVASRVTVVPLKPGSEASMLAICQSMRSKLDDKEWDECIEVNVFFTDNKMVSLSRYTSQAGLDAVGAKMQEYMAPMQPFMAGTPERLAGSTIWDLPTIIKVAKGKKQKKGCC
jgi:hypothetical protein